MPHSHHSHSGEFCKHGNGRLEDMILEAKRKGFKMYALTEHCPRWREEDLYDEEVKAHITPADLRNQFKAFITAAHHLRTTHECEGFDILIGLETENIYDEDLEKLKSLLREHKVEVDFIVGSVHHVKDWPIDFSQDLFEQCIRSFVQGEVVSDLEEEKSLNEVEYRAGLGRLLEEYFHAQRRMMEQLRPKVIAHFSLPLLFAGATPSHGFPTLASFPEALALARSNIEYAISYGALIELNSAALRKGLSFAWPGKDVVDIVLELEGNFCLSDDAHSIEQIATNYAKMREWAMEVGIPGERVHRLTKKDGKAVAECVGNIWEDPFWNQC